MGFYPAYEGIEHSRMQRVSTNNVLLLEITEDYLYYRRSYINVREREVK